MRIGWLNFEKVHGNTNVGSSRIRSYWITKYWEDAETFKYGTKYDAVVFQKAYVPSYMEAYDGIKILDICDPDWMAMRLFAKTLAMADAVVTSTEGIAEYLRKMTKVPVVVIPDRHDMVWYGEPKKHTDLEATSVAWFGYGHNATGVKHYANELKKLKLQVHLYADAEPSWSNYDFIKFHKYDVKTVNDQLKKHDFVFLPENEENPNFYMKSNNKEVSCWFLGLPVAKMRKDLIGLISPMNRKTVADRNLKEAVEKWQVKDSVVEWKKLLGELSDK